MRIAIREIRERLEADIVKYARAYISREEVETVFPVAEKGEAAIAEAARPLQAALQDERIAFRRAGEEMQARVVAAEAQLKRHQEEIAALQRALESARAERDAARDDAFQWRARYTDLNAKTLEAFVRRANR